MIRICEYKVQLIRKKRKKSSCSNVFSGRFCFSAIIISLRDQDILFDGFFQSEIYFRYPKWIEKKSYTL